MVGVILVAHHGLASAMLKAVEAFLGYNTHLYALDLDETTTPEELERQLAGVLGLCAAGDCLVITDLYGGTPWRVAVKVAESSTRRDRIAIISGMNLSVVLEACVLTDDNLALAQLVDHLTNVAQSSVRSWPEAHR